MRQLSSIILIFIWINTAQAEDGLLSKTWNYIKKDASVTAGIGSRLFSLAVNDANNKVLGKFVENDDEAYYLIYSGRPTFIRNSRFGYRWMLNLSTFSADEQEIAEKQTQNLGTRTWGVFGYVVPSFFVNFGDHHKGRYFRIGLGLGLGTSHMEGNMQLNYSSTPSQRINLKNENKINTAIGAFAELRLAHFVMRLANAGPVVALPPHTAKISDVSFMLGISHFLD